MKLEHAGKKLRQSEFLLDHLRAQSKQIAIDMRRCVPGDHGFALEAFFSACIAAARSSYTTLQHSGGGPFCMQWLETGLDEQGRAFFESMRSLRNRDIHLANTGTEALPTMIELDSNQNGFYAWRNPKIYGPDTLLTHVHPDGSSTQAQALQSTVRLYLNIGGQKIDAVSACTDFIGQLRSLLCAAQTAVPSSDSTEASAAPQAEAGSQAAAPAV